MVVPKLLPYDVHEPPKGFNSFTAKAHELIPLSAQRAFRDRHAHWFDRAVSVSAVALAARHPKALLRFLALRRSAQVFQYGLESSQQVVELHQCGKQGAPVVIFMHGGAWFSGRPWMYRLIATALNRQGLDVGIVGYGTYKTLPPIPGTLLPDPALEGIGDFSVVLGNVDHQIDDLQHCLEFLMTDPRSPYSIDDTPIFLSGHSSGAHVCSLLLLRQALGLPGHATLPRPIAGFIGLSGVYDVAAHHEYEARRGVHEISGMGPCNGGLAGFHRNSPTTLAGMLTAEQAEKLPPCLILHGVEDETVPFTSSLVFANCLEGHGGRVKTGWLPGMDHQGTVAVLMMGRDSEVERQIAAFSGGKGGRKGEEGVAPMARL
ncbi:isoprenylcysteine alpha-carbonyl methylesterase icmel1-like [Nannochloropsis oceanica]